MAPCVRAALLFCFLNSSQIKIQVTPKCLKFGTWKPAHDARDVHTKILCAITLSHEPSTIQSALISFHQSQLLQLLVCAEKLFFHVNDMIHSFQVFHLKKHEGSLKARCLSSRHPCLLSLITMSIFIYAHYTNSSF